MNKWLLLTYVFGISGLIWLFSFTQVDLNLTLVNAQAYLNFQQPLTELGYFQRPTNTLIWAILLLVTSLGWVGIWLNSKMISSISKNFILKLLLASSIVLTLAYPVFTYDVFNYIFDARILVEHQANPYTHTALDFPADDWTRFMHWTHRTYPYGPTWLAISIVSYFLGLGKFVLTLISFKLLAWMGYLASLIGLYWFWQSSKDLYYRLILFGLHPLVLIEGLVNAHLDMLMLGLMLLAIGWWQKTDNLDLISGLSAAVSIGIKYVSGAMLPLIILKDRLGWQRSLDISLILAYLLTLIVISQRELYPWYFLVPLGLTWLSRSKIWHLLTIALTPALLVRYLPYLYYGDYLETMQSWRFNLTWVIFALVSVCLLLLIKSKYIQQQSLFVMPKTKSGS